MSTNSAKPVLLRDLMGTTKTWKIEFKFQMGSPERDGYVQVLVDGRELDLEVGWDLLAIVASGRAPGGYYLGNCCCGAPGCANIWYPVMVRHQGDTITWCVPTPYSRNRSDKSPQATIELSFDLAQYRAQSDGLLADFKCAATDGARLMRLDCYPGNLPRSLIEEAERGWAGYGGKVDLQN